jgi:hypothetical protein
MPPPRAVQRASQSDAATVTPCLAASWLAPPAAATLACCWVIVGSAGAVVSVEVVVGSVAVAVVGGGEVAEDVAVVWSVGEPEPSSPDEISRAARMPTAITSPTTAAISSR